MYNITEYNEKYNQDINDFVISIYVKEYGFKEHEDIVRNINNNTYIEQGGNFWIAFDNEEIIGTIAIWKHDEKNAEIKRLYIKKEYRGQGLSYALYEKVIQYCKENKFKKIFVGTHNKLERAIQFYLKKGFQEIEDKRNENGERFFELYLDN